MNMKKFLTATGVAFAYVCLRLFVPRNVSGAQLLCHECRDFRAKRFAKPLALCRRAGAGRTAGLSVVAGDGSFSAGVKGGMTFGMLAHCS